MAEASSAAVARPLSAEALAGLLEGRGGFGVLLVDSRPFADFNASHIADAVNVSASKLLKRRLLQGKVHVRDVLRHAAGKQLALEAGLRVVVYDENSRDASALRRDAFAGVLLLKLQPHFPSVQLLAGGFSEFSRQFARLCEGKQQQQTPAPPAASGPTRILPHLYLGCQRDVLNEEAMRRHAIAYVLNASNTCPKPDFIPDSRFLRVPVDDGFRDKILPWLDASLDFIGQQAVARLGPLARRLHVRLACVSEEAEASDACVLVHCLAGISRSATIAIAYIMKRMDMTLDEAYRFVKEKRPSISPNFNFLGQLLDFEKKISRQVHDEGPPARALASLGLEEPARPKRRFSLDFKTCGQTAAAAGDGALESACQFSPVAEVCERSPDKEEAGLPFGLPTRALRGRRSEIPPSAAGGRDGRSSSDTARFCPTAGAVRRRGRPPAASHRGDSRRSWHEESNFEKTRSCHGWTEKEPAARQRFSASLELIRVS